MCAQRLGQRGKSVLVLEHANRVGKKILMSGGGRCNFTNLHTTPANFISNNPHFCKSALARYTPKDFIALVRKHRIAFHEKELGQLFCDDSSKQIVQLLLDECTAGNVRILTSTAVHAVRAHDAAFQVESAAGSFSASQLVIASGGLSVPSMGATGFGYEIAEQFGHSVRATRAGLVPLTLSGSYQTQYCDLSGLALPILARAGKTAFENAMLITHRGLSGPAILQISSYYEPYKNTLAINLLPAGAEALLLAARKTHGQSSVSDWLTQVLPKRFAQRLCEVHADELPSQRLADMTKAAMQRWIALLTAWPIVPSGNEGYRTAEVTLGGVDTDAIHSASMQSKRVPGLYFIGEVLDVTGHLGGFNFQWAWASAVAAADAIAASNA
jgi:predicted Rossmann fold flavoprotein